MPYKALATHLRHQEELECDLGERSNILEIKTVHFSLAESYAIHARHVKRMMEEAPKGSKEL